MEPKKNEQKTFTFFQRLKSVKHFEIIIAVLFCAILLVIYISSLGTSSKTGTTTTSLTTEEYASYLEKKLSGVLADINGAGKVKVMLTLECGIEYVYATTSEEVTNSTTNDGTTNSKTTTTENLVLVTVSGKPTPVIVKQNLPKVSGVLVVAQGAGDFAVKLEILKAVQAILNVPTTNIEILVGSK